MNVPNLGGGSQKKTHHPFGLKNSKLFDTVFFLYNEPFLVMFQGRFIRQKMGVFYFDFFLKDLQVKIPEISAGGIRMWERKWGDL